MTFASGMRVRRSRIPTALEDGGTGSRTREEAVAALGVPSLDGDNVFTGVNEFQGVLQSNGGLELTLPSGFLNVIDEDGHINVLDFSGTSSGRVYALPDADGTIALSGDPLQTAYNAQGSTYAASTADCVINCSGTFTVTLPTAVGVSGRFYFVKNSGAGVVTVACTGGQTIDGAATQAVAASACMQVCSDGANWIIL